MFTHEGCFVSAEEMHCAKDDLEHAASIVHDFGKHKAFLIQVLLCRNVSLAQIGKVFFTEDGRCGRFPRTAPEDGRRWLLRQNK